MLLTDIVVRQAKPGSRNYTLKDTDGLALFMSVAGAKSWHFRFSWGGKQPRISLGTYPEISLKELGLCLHGRTGTGLPAEG